VASLERTLMQETGLKALKNFLAEKLDYDQYSVHVADHLMEILRECVPGGKEDAMQALARKCVRNEADVVDEINKVLAPSILNMDRIRPDARARKAEELVQDYLRREPDAVTLIDELLTDAGVSMNTFLTKVLCDKTKSTISSGSTVCPPSPRPAATAPCARLTGVARSSAKRCDAACTRSRTTTSPTAS
jgi:hypothetical protein